MTLIASFVKICIIVLVLGYMLLCIGLFIFQDTLLFFPQVPHESHYKNIESNVYVKNYKITTQDGNIIDGWWQVNQKNKNTIIYFWGNAEETSYFIEKTAYKNTNVISFNYRWYGRSEWKPTQNMLFSDAWEIYTFVNEKLWVKKENLYVMWRSLGSGIATYLASQKNVAGVILVTPYDSILSVASELYPFIPVKFLLRHKFLSEEYAQFQQNRLLVIYGWQDSVVPNWHTEKLIDTWNGEIIKKFLPDATHDNILDFSEAKSSIEEFLD